MLSRICLFAGALGLSVCAMAASPSIGTITARGFTSIDSSRVEGGGTLFDGSVVETGYSALSSADLRLGRGGAVVTVNINSRGTVYSDHFVLQRGSVQFGSQNSFRVLANGLVVVASDASSRGTVGIDDANAVTIESQTGTLEVRNAAGATVAAVHPGHPLSFNGAGGDAQFSAEGTVSSENGRYYFTATETGEKYELKGESLKGFDGATVIASGVLAGGGSGAGVAGVLSAKRLQGWSGTPSLIGGGISITRPKAYNIVMGGDGGFCDSKQEVPCCQNVQGGNPFNGKKCCPGFLPTKQQCGGSQ